MRSLNKTVRIPVALLESIDALRAPGQPLAEYRSLNAAVVGILRYTAAFPRPHGLTTGIDRLAPDEQDLIDDFTLVVVKRGVDLREHLPKPATAEALLELARKWKTRQ